jgi:microcystin-dependent protein
MKRLLLSIFFLSIYVANFAQANVTGTSISIQGVARNSSNNAIANSSVAISAELYYLNTSNVATTILTRSSTVNTDAFGVFAYGFDLTNSDFAKISNAEAWIKISSGGVVFAQEKLMTVPYSIHAQNGAPTGSIMPYVGSTAPAGWLICNGDAIPSGAEYDALKKVLGSGSTPATNVPDLRAMFLRGTGTSAQTGYTAYSGPSLKSFDGEAFKSHTHTQQGTITTTTNGSHLHTMTFYNDDWNGRGGAQNVDSGGLEDDGGAGATKNTSTAGDHTHTVTLTGATTSTGGTETKPVNYGINYIIKI